MTDRPVTRRRAIRAAGGLALAATAGCTTSNGDGNGDGEDGGSTPSGNGTTAEPTPTETPTAGPLALRPVATGFNAPLDLADAPGDGLRYVADQTGRVSAIDPDGGVDLVLDLSARVELGREMGLLGLALHPAFEENRRLFVRYSSPRRAGTPTGFSHTFVLSEFLVGDGGRRVDRDSERVLLTIPEPQGNHNAGSIVFGPDGYLYVGVGDGGGRGDAGPGHASDWYGELDGGNGQDVTENLLGSILRLDVDREEGNRPYGIPNDNPLVGRAGLDEHYAWGFRNPWRMSFDGSDLYAGDVGQSAYEEVDLVERGGNYGWNVKEGAHCYGADACPSETADDEPLIDPIIEYPHGDAPVSGLSVIGGYVYRGDELPDLDGRYVFGDLNTRGRLFVASRPAGDGLWPVGPVEIGAADRGKLTQLLSFGRDAAGRLYVLGQGDGDGGVYELVPPG